MLFNLFSNKKNKDISVKQLKDEYLKEKKGKYFLDVRTKAEFKNNHIRGFENISVDQLPNQLNKLPKDKEIVVICQSGGRSSMACNILTKNGFEQVTNVMGGMSAYND